MTLKLASGSYDGTIRFWDPSSCTNNSSETIRLPAGSIANQIDISEDKSKLIVGMASAVRIYDLNKSDSVLRSFEGDFKGNVTAVGFWKQDKLAYTACEDGVLRIHDFRAKTVAKVMKQSKPINCAVIHPNQGDILSGDEGGNFKIWEIRFQKEKVSILSQNQVGIRSIAISQTGEHMVFSDSKGVIHPYGEHLLKWKPIQAHDDYILKVQLSPNNKFMATCSADKKIKLFRVAMEGSKFDISEYRTLKGHFRWVWDCQFSCDSAYLISCSTDCTIKLWDVEKGELVQTLKGHQKGVVCLALNDIAQGGG